MMQALELLRLAKRHVSRRSDVEQRRNLDCSYSYASLKASVSKSVSFLVGRLVGWSVSQPVENAVN